MSMGKTYIAKDANRRLREHLETMGRDLELVETEGIVSKPLSNHPDIFLFKMGISEDAPVFYAMENHLGPEYPRDCAYNAACTGKFFIHNFSITDPALLQAAKDMGMTLIDVNQGYTKCNVAIIDETSIITSDRGIAAACEDYPELTVLLIEPGYIRLDGFDTGFIGGASGKAGNEFIFNGNLAKHPDFAQIVDFVESHGLTPKWFPEYQLTDIGSIL